MILVDTGYLVALFHPRDGLHPVARAWSAVLDEPLIVTEHVLVEVVNRFSQPTDRVRAERIAAVVRGDSAYVFLQSSSQLLDAALAMHRQHHDKEWSLTDCISFHVMRERAVPRALSHDRHFVQAGFDALLRRDP
ncbi:MAG TPA: PIN domain-containing protein [Tepidisphaeraceae bacterium]|nr:PIN domain-containing protein [Tepidisphaeraceae bacterium]